MALSLKSGLVTREKEQAQAHRKHEGEVWGIDSNACVDDSRSHDRTGKEAGRHYSPRTEAASLGKQELLLDFTRVNE